jgi:hypothetical protein
MRRDGRAIFIGLVIGLQTLHGFAKRPISVGQSRQLIIALLKPDGWTKLKGFELVDDNLPGQVKIRLGSRWGGPRGDGSHRFPQLVSFGTR